MAFRPTQDFDLRGVHVTTADRDRGLNRLRTRGKRTISVSGITENLEMDIVT